MAIGQLVWNSELAQLHVAVFINSHPVHLDYQKAIKTIAKRKSQNISAMSPGAVAVVNADMHESATVQAAALAHGLRLLTYGQGAGTDIRAISVSGTDGVVPVEIQGSRLEVPTIGIGPHTVENAMAVAGARSAFDLPVEPLMSRLGSFDALAGRWLMMLVTVGGGWAQILDRSYNANPASMRAALDELELLPCSGRRIAILGQIVEQQ